MQNHFEINVSLRGQHVFATAARSLTERTKAWALLADFQIRFPEDQGYKVTMRYYETVGHFCTEPEEAGTPR